MNKYNNTIYPSRKDIYTPKLCKYLIDRFFKSGILLDLGCGTGIHIKEFELYMSAMGIDKDTCNLESDKLLYSDNTIDNIFCKSVIEHLHNPENMMSEVHRVLKPKGIFVIMTPDWKSQMNHFWDDYTHVHPYTIKSLMNLFKIFDYQLVGCEYFYQLPFIWRYPFLKFIPKLISLLPDVLKWKDQTMSNGKDRKLIRFSKEKMILAWGYK